MKLGDFLFLIQDEEAIKYIMPWLFDTAGNKIYVTTE